MAAMSWSVNIQISGGPGISASAASQPIEATDRVEVVIAPGDTDRVVDLQPGAATAIRLLMIKSSRYGDDLAYTVSDGTDDSDPITLDGPQIFTAGSAALFGVAPRQLKFTNTNADHAAAVEIFVARDATP